MDFEITHEEMEQIVEHPTPELIATIRERLLKADDYKPDSEVTKNIMESLNGIEKEMIFSISKEDFRKLEAEPTPELIDKIRNRLLKSAEYKKDPRGSEIILKGLNTIEETIPSN